MNDLQLIYGYKLPLATTEYSGIVEIRNNPQAVMDANRLVVSLNENPTGGTSIGLVLETSDTVTFDTVTTVQAFNFTVADDGTTPPQVLTQLGVPNLKRYSRFHFVPTGTFTSGAVSIFISAAPEQRFKDIEGDWF